MSSYEFVCCGKTQIVDLSEVGGLGNYDHEYDVVGTKPVVTCPECGVVHVIPPHLRTDEIMEQAEKNRLDEVLRGNKW